MTRPSEWPLAQQFKATRGELERALAYAGGTHTLDDIWQGVIEGRFQLWTAPHSVMVTEVLEYPRCRALHYFLAAGKMDELEALYPAVLAWGKSVGCTRASLAGRPGWARSFLAADGWKANHVVMTKEWNP